MSGEKSNQAFAGMRGLAKQASKFQAERDRYKAMCDKLAERGAKVMEMLEEEGPEIVPHLLDTDENAGEKFREVLAEYKEMTGEK